MRKSSFVKVFALAAAACFAMATVALAESHVRIVRLSDVDGSVQADRGTGEGFTTAITNMPVVEGMQIWTRDGSRAEVEFENGSTVRLAGGARLSFPKLSLDDDGTKVTGMQIEGGTSYFDLKPGKHDEFTLSFGSKRINVKRGTAFRIVAGTTEAELAVMHGSVDVLGDAESVEVSKNHTATFPLEQGGVQVAHGIQSGPFDDWNHQQGDYHDRYMQSSYAGSPYRYGSSDLAYFGNYFYAPGYGNVWQPFGAGAGWDPFGDGAWMFYPGVGYTWVSWAPWGWLPYRYGGWNFLPGYGWCWSPGGWNSWSAGPVIASAPITYQGPKIPVKSTGGPVPAPVAGQGLVVVMGGKPVVPVAPTAVAGKPSPVVGIPLYDQRWERPVLRANGSATGTLDRSSGGGLGSSGGRTAQPASPGGGNNHSSRPAPSINPHGDRSSSPSPSPRPAPAPAPHSSPSPAPARPHAAASFSSEGNASFASSSFSSGSGTSHASSSRH